MSATAFVNGTVIRSDRLDRTTVMVDQGRIAAFGSDAGTVVDLKGKYLAPGFVDIHIHGGGGADFMDLTADAFQTVCRTHLKHGTTSLTPTSTVSHQKDYATFLSLCRELRGKNIGARIVGAHLYGPYFAPNARGCHPRLDYLTPDVDHLGSLAGFGKEFPCSVTIAPELENAVAMTRACVEQGLIVNIGHSHATFEQVEASMQAGATHVDHLFCAMSDRARLRQSQAFPMRAGVMEATLAFDRLTTEVIADGWHLADSLLRTAYRIKGPDRLALVTDSMRAVDCPDGEYWFGPANDGERIRRKGDVGVTLDGTGLASGVMGMDHLVRTMHNAVKATLPAILRCASLTPARIIGLDSEIGSIEIGKRADFVVLNDRLEIEAVYLGGELV
jgi:N-acetylglucosamine-6-phosphate deacetylase